MIGAGRKRIRLTVEIFEEEKDKVMQLMRGASTTCEVVSMKRVKANVPGRQFEIPAAPDGNAPPEPICLFHRQNEIQAAVSGPERAEPAAEAPAEVTACEFCLQARCITASPFKPQGRSDARITNHNKRRKEYRWYWKTLKDCGLWENARYIERKGELGCLIDDVREVMPCCVIKDVRGRWPNPANVPYQGHRRS